MFGFSATAKLLALVLSSDLGFDLSIVSQDSKRGQQTRAPSATAREQELPETMTRLEVRLQSPEISRGSFAAKPKVMYRAGTQYCRTEEMPDAEHGIHGVAIVNGPDVWMVNLFTKTAQHLVDPGPTFNCRMSIFPAKSAADRKSQLAELEFGRELGYFKGRGATPKQGPVLGDKPTTVYTAAVGDSLLFLFTTGTPERPWAVARQHGSSPAIYWYGAYGQLPFDPQLFAKPKGARIEDVKQVSACSGPLLASASASSAGPRLSTAQLWAIAAGANLAYERGDGLDRLEFGCGARCAQTMLRGGWGVNGTSDAEPMLVLLARVGHTAVLRLDLAALSSVPQAKLEPWLRAQPPDRRQRLRFAYQHRVEFKNGELLGWDLGRLINVARAAYTAGWMDESTAWAHILPAARRLQQAYSSWDELSQNYLLGRRYWAGADETQVKFEAAAAWLRTNPQSPWRQLDWSTPLDRGAPRTNAR
jgi:hypothetical protein